MLPDFETVDYTVMAIAAAMSLVIPLLPFAIAYIYALVVDRALPQKVKFAFISGLLAYGFSTLVFSFVFVPITVVNTFLTPRWHLSGHEEFADFLWGIESFSAEISMWVFPAVLSVVIPVRFLRFWRDYFSHRAA